MGITAAKVTLAENKLIKLDTIKNIIPAKLADSFNVIIDGKQVSLFKLENKHGTKAYITNYGGRLVSLYVHDKYGKMKDVVQGFDNVRDYQKSTEPYFGATIGRYSNRIAKGRFILNNKVYKLFINNAPNTLHGGKRGFRDVVWDAKQLNSGILELSYLSKDMEEGFPGDLKVKVIYSLTEDNSLKITYEASTDKTTVINLTNHAFFNLNG